MEAVCKIVGGGEGPAAVAVHHRGADGFTVIVNREGGSGLAAAAKDRTGIVGGLIAVE